MRIALTSIFVDDQDKALAFYTDVLGFEKKSDFPVGEARWITVVSPEGGSDVELVLEPNTNPAASAFQKALFEQKIPVNSFASRDVRAEYQRLKARGVTFVREPMEAGPVIIAMFADTCGNLVQMHQLVG